MWWHSSVFCCFTATLKGHLVTLWITHRVYRVCVGVVLNKQTKIHTYIRTYIYRQTGKTKINSAVIYQNLKGVIHRVIMLYAPIYMYLDLSSHQPNWKRKKAKPTNKTTTYVCASKSVELLSKSSRRKTGIPHQPTRTRGTKPTQTPSRDLNKSNY